MMDVTNRRVAEILRSFGELLEVSGDEPFRVRAYRRAADSIERLDRPVAGLTWEELIGLGSIGKNIAAKIIELRETGSIREYDELMNTVPLTLVELLKLDGIGPKTVHRLWKKMGITSISELESAARGHRIRVLHGFGEKKEKEILDAIEQGRQQSRRMNRLEAERIIGEVSDVFGDARWSVAGSFRRGKSTIGDIDIVTVASPSRVAPLFRSLAEAVIDEGERRMSIRIQGRRVDIRFTRSATFGSMLMYLTGSKAFNIRLRSLAGERGWKLNEYGIEDLNSGTVHRFAEESRIFEHLGMESVPPELREDSGEVEHALAGTLPILVTAGDIRGDLHTHSSWSDGNLDLSELAQQGASLGYEYLLCSDHSASLGVARGLDAAGIRKQQHEIEFVNRGSVCRLLAGVEVDILSDGTLGLPGDILDELDLVIASVHTGFKQERDVITRRLIRAMENDSVDIIGHPTGRLIGRRPPYAIDMDRVIETARDTHTALELNASPFRLDLDDIYVRRAIEEGVKIAIGSDAHRAGDLFWMQHGVGVARRGWCRADDAINTRPLRELLEWAA
jgi:DNA polymerase (family 10)